MTVDDFKEKYLFLIAESLPNSAQNKHANTKNKSRLSFWAIEIQNNQQRDSS